jgi:hypothetical protein
MYCWNILYPINVYLPKIIWIWFKLYQRFLNTYSYLKYCLRPFWFFKLLKLGPGPLARPAHLAGSNPTDWVLGRSNRPSLVPLALSLSTLSLLLRPWSPPPLEDSSLLRWFPPPSTEAYDRLHAVYLSSKWIRNPSLVQGDPLPLLIRIPQPQSPPSSPSTTASWAGVEGRCCGGCGGRAAPVEASQVERSWCYHGATTGEAVPGLHLAGHAGTAPACHPGRRLGAWWVTSTYPLTALSAFLLLPLPLFSGQVTCAMMCSSTTALSSVYCLLRFLQCVLVL